MILTEALIQEIQKLGNIPWAKLDNMLKESANDCSRFCFLVARHGFADLDSLGMLVGNSMQKAYLNLRTTLFQAEVLAKVGRETALKYKAIPVYTFGATCVVAMSNPQDLGALMVIEKLVGSQVDPVYSFDDEIEAAIKVHYESADKVTVIANGVDLDALARMDESKLADLKPIVAMSESIVLIALKERVSDIHIEPKKRECLVRFRVDGSLATRFTFPVALVRPLVARYKVMANMDIAECRRPQDGRISFPTPVKNIDIRVSTLPVVHGEKVVMRLLGSLSSDVPLNLDKLGISDHILGPLKAMLNEPNGIIFVTGPTGSGKSTTLYASLNYLDSPDSNITTIEDPVEYEVSSLNQSAVDAKAGRTFQLILRSILRQDPDVVLVGEIRDGETASIAAQAALTGHLVLSSLHTNNALQALTRLIDMGVEPHVVAPSVLGVVGQRLVRKLCPACRTPYTPSTEDLHQYFTWEEGVEVPSLYRSSGCSECGGSGFRGRVAIHEVFRISQRIREQILRGSGYMEIRSLAYQGGFLDMRYDGFRKAFSGLTTIDEVVRATSSDA